MAELNGTDAASIKSELGLDPDLGGASVEELKERFSLKASVDADTPWREVERDVLRAAERLEAGAGDGGHGAE